MSVTKPGMPHADSKIARYLRKQIDALAGIKNQRQIAHELGYERPNIISMFKRGETKVPLDKVPALARSLNVDPAFLFKLALEQSWPDLTDTIEEIFGGIQTRNQRRWWEVICEASEQDDPALTADFEEELRKLVKEHYGPRS